MDTECYYGRHRFMNGKCSRENCNVDQNNLITIHANRWFSKTYGNTYHKVYITFPDLSTITSGETYGYDRQFEQTALNLIANKMGIELKAKDRLNNFLTDHGYYSNIFVSDVTRKRDM